MGRVKEWCMGWLDTFLGIGVCILFALLVIGCGVVVVKIVDARVCSEKTKEIGLEHQYGWFSGCRVQAEDGSWIPLENYVYIDREEQ